MPSARRTNLRAGKREIVQACWSRNVRPALDTWKDVRAAASRVETLGPFPLFRAPPSSAELLNREMRNKRPRSMLPRRHDFKRAPRTKGEAPAPQTDGVKRTWHAAKSAAASPSDQRCDDPAPVQGRNQNTCGQLAFGAHSCRGGNETSSRLRCFRALFFLLQGRATAVQRTPSS